MVPRTADAVIIGGGAIGACAAYYLARRGLRACLLGGCRRHVGFDRAADPRVLELIRRRVRRFVPRAATLPEAGAFVNFRPYGPDHAPLVGPVEGLGGFYLATGHEGMGVSLAPATGELIADLLSGRLPAVDPTAFLPTPARLKPPSVNGQK
jgi:glycine/D-amino acid oxidase-like deaminating enzyme